MVGCAIQQLREDTENLALCKACAERQYMQLMPPCSKLQLKPGAVGLRGRITGEVIGHLQTRVLVLWKGTGEDPASVRAMLDGVAPDSMTFVALPSVLLKEYDIELPKGGR